MFPFFLLLELKDLFWLSCCTQLIDPYISRKKRMWRNVTKDKIYKSSFPYRVIFIQLLILFSLETVNILVYLSTNYIFILIHSFNAISISFHWIWISWWKYLILKSVSTRIFFNPKSRKLFLTNRLLLFNPWRSLLLPTFWLLVES